MSKKGSMRVRPFDGPDETCRVVVLSLGDDAIVLVAVDACGNCVEYGNLLVVDQRGVTLCEGIAENLGFDLDRKGQLPILNRVVSP